MTNDTTVTSTHISHWIIDRSGSDNWPIVSDLFQDAKLEIRPARFQLNVASAFYESIYTSILMTPWGDPAIGYTHYDL